MSKLQVGKQYIVPSTYDWIGYTFFVKKVASDRVTIVWTRESESKYDVEFTSNENEFLEAGARLITKLDKALK